MNTKLQGTMRRLYGRLMLGGLLLIGSGASLLSQPIADDQGDVGIGGLLPDPSAILDLTTSSKGFLLPRLTTAQRNAIAAPALGLMIYNTDDGTPQIWSDASGSPKWDSIITTGSSYGWLTQGNPGLVNGVNNFFGTTDGTPIRVITSNVERMRIEAGGHVGINQVAPSARLDVVGDGSDPAIEASNSAGAIALQATVDAGSGLILGSVPAISGDNDDQTGVAGTSNTGIGVFGASNTNHGVNGLSLGTGVAGIHGRNDQAGGFGVLGTSFGPATGVFGSSQTGNAGAFSVTNGASTADAVLIDNAGSGKALEVNNTGAGDALEVNNNGAGDALEVNVTGGGPGIDLNGGELDGNDQGNALGDGTASQQLTVRGLANAVIGNTLAGNPTVWDLVIQGDAVATGLMKLGGSMWLDGVSVPHQMSANNALLITTTSGDITINSAGGTTTVDDDLVVTGDLSVSGPFSLPGLTQGSVLFTGPGGTISEDNNNLFYDDAINRLGVGTSNTSARLTVLETGSVPAVQATTAGTGNAGLFQITNAGNTSSIINASTNSIGGGISVQLTNASNGSRGIDVTQAGVGPGVFATSTGGTGVEGITSSISAAGVMGRNTFGEAVVGINRGGNGVGAVVGRNDSSGYGVRGFNTKNGIGVLGQAGISGGTGVGGRFENVNAANTSSTLQVQTNGIGSGIDVNLTNASNGARGIDVNQSGVGPGVFATSAGGNGVWGITSSISAAGVIGDNTFGEAVVGRNRGGNGVGAVVGRNDSSGYGVRGFNTKDGIGVIGQAGISGGNGTAGRFENVNAANVSSTVVVTTNGIGNGISVSLPNASNGGRGLDVTQSGVGPGVFSTSAGGNAVWGITSSISAAGVIGDNTFGEAVVGRNRGGNGVGAVVGRNDSSGYGVRGFNTKNGYGVLGQAGISGGTGTAGRFENVNAANTSDALQVVTNSAGNAARFTGNVVVNGNLTVSGTVAKGGGSFMIDHPLDPENRILFHSFVESPDMKNINDGVVQLDAKGEAWVELPEWFEALNGDFRYQLTPIGAPGPGLYIADEISGNRFRIAGGTPGMKVSWMVTGIRHDPWAEKNRIRVEVDKSADQRGTYLHPQAYGVEAESLLRSGMLDAGAQQTPTIQLSSEVGAQPVQVTAPVTEQTAAPEKEGARAASSTQLSSEGTQPTVERAAQSTAPTTAPQTAVPPVASERTDAPSPRLPE